MKNFFRFKELLREHSTPGHNAAVLFPHTGIHCFQNMERVLKDNVCGHTIESMSRLINCGSELVRPTHKLEVASTSQIMGTDKQVMKSHSNFCLKLSSFQEARNKLKAGKRVFLLLAGPPELIPHTPTLCLQMYILNLQGLYAIFILVINV